MLKYYVPFFVHSVISQYFIQHIFCLYHCSLFNIIYQYNLVKADKDIKMREMIITIQNRKAERSPWQIFLDESELSRHIGRASSTYNTTHQYCNDDKILIY
ncbi:hypothetical protein RF11_05038 [Thelohanellus kitauei]|uniref:Uncharacterized protein n=1 Tax=Thelohanellus kitauei TaxID=669202 RepID=A0A0C2M143_THEKT|nr:hypothetical protein RF11_05038 [Thelohanellus kitauei]